MAQVKQTDIIGATLRLLQAGFWPDGKSIEAALKELEFLQRNNDQLKAGLLPFAKMGAKVIYSPDMPPLIDYQNLQISYSDLVKAADLLFGKGERPEEEKD